MTSNETGRSAPVRAPLTRRDALGMGAMVAAAALGGRPAHAASGKLTWGIHVSIAPSWLDPAETNGLVTPFMLLYAVHDGVVKPMPDQLYAPSLASSWQASEDGLTYEFTLRDGAIFHNGEPIVMPRTSGILSNVTAAPIMGRCMIGLTVSIHPMHDTSASVSKAHGRTSWHSIRSRPEQAG